MELLISIYRIKVRMRLFHVGDLNLYTIFGLNINNFILITLISLNNKALIFRFMDKVRWTKWL